MRAAQLATPHRATNPDNHEEEMLMTDILRDKRDEIRDALNTIIPDADMANLEKQAQAIADEIASTVEYNIKENLA